ncbi:MAG: MFS transporter [Acidimicrobiia bacterium]|nr:MFS transporter [Acidimicrobiia bacterium]
MTSSPTGSRVPGLSPARPNVVAGGAGMVLLTLASAQFLMTLDTSVMNVAIATVANDVGSSVTGIQLAITMYTLVMAALMIAGGKIGQIIGRRRAFAIGCVVYGSGSFVTGIAQSLPVLIFGWSLLEGMGAALILPSIVALVASNFDKDARPRAYGLMAAAGAGAVAIGPLVGGLCTTYLTWRVVFFAEVVLVAVILLLTRRMSASPSDRTVRLDVVGTVLSAVGLGLVVYAILQSGSWGFVRPRPGEPSWFGLSPVVWIVLAGGAVLLGFLEWQRRRLRRGRSPLLDPALLSIQPVRGGLTALFFQFLLQAGLFFTVPLFLSVALGLSAVETGVRIMPLSAALLVAAVGVPRIWPHVSPRRMTRVGLLLLFGGIVVFMLALEEGAGPGIITWPMILAGLGIGALASQLGSVTVSSAPDEQSGEVGALQNTVTNLGASIGTALAGAVLIAALSASFLTGISENPAVPDRVATAAEVELSSGVPFISDAELSIALDDAGVPAELAAAVVEENTRARIDGLREALAVLAGIALLGLFLARSIPTEQPGAAA